MLYLIRSFGRGGKTLLKIGYTSDLNSRLRTYKTQNPLIEPISSRQGTELEELKVQLYLWKYKSGVGDEWFIDCPEVLSGFHDSHQTIDRRIWSDRESVFKHRPWGNKRALRIYEDLRMINGGGNKPVDKDWKIYSNKQLIRNYKPPKSLYMG